MDLSGDEVARLRLREAAEKAKAELASSASVRIHVTYLATSQDGPVHLDTRLTRAQLQAIVGTPVVGDAVDVVLLPLLGPSVTEGTVARWFKAVGDEVAVDEPLVELSTHLVDIEISSSVSGVLDEIVVPVDEAACVGAVLGRIRPVLPGASTTPVKGRSASVGLRLCAAVLDVAVVLVPVVLVGWATTPLLAALTGSALLVSQVVNQALRGWTVGQGIMRLRLVDHSTREPAGLGRAAVRLLVVIGGGLAGGVGALVVLVSPWFDRTGQRRGWHDVLTGTAVIDLGVAGESEADPPAVVPLRTDVLRSCIFVVLLVVAGAGIWWVVARSNEPNASEPTGYVVWDGGTGTLALGEPPSTPTYVIASQDQLPRQITCTPTLAQHVTVDLDPLVLTADAWVSVEIGAQCQVNLYLPAEANFMIDWEGIDSFSGESTGFVDSEFSQEPVWLDKRGEYSNVPSPHEPVLHLAVKAEGKLYVWPSYTMWNYGTAAFPVPSHDIVRYTFPSSAQTPQSITCTNAAMTGLDFRNAKLTADVDVTVRSGPRCLHTTVLFSPEQNWSIDWAGSGSGVLEVGEGAGPEARTIATGTGTVAHLPDPEAPAIRLTVTSASTVHVRPDRAVY